MDKKTHDNYITQKDSGILYGIAILMMIFHHCFVMPGRLNLNYYPVLGGFGTESRIALMAKLCVVIYAAITGYALSKKSNPCREGGPRFIYDLKVSACMLLKLYSRLWLVCLVFLPVGAAFFGMKLDFLSLVKAVFLGSCYNTEWWYVLEYIYFLLLFPAADTLLFLYEKERKPVYAAAVCAAVLTLMVLLYFNLYIPYLPYWAVFLVFYAIGRYGVFETVSGKVHIPSWAAWLGIVVVLAIRWFAVINPFESRLDIVIGPVFVYLLVSLIHGCREDSPILKALSCLGKHSTFMWLTHTFWIYYFFQNIILLPYYSVLIFIWAVAVSLANAWLFEHIYSRCGIGRAVKKISKRIMNES